MAVNIYEKKRRKLLRGCYCCAVVYCCLRCEDFFVLEASMLVYRYLVQCTCTVHLYIVRLHFGITM